MVKRLLADELSAGWLRIVGIESRGAPLVGLRCWRSCWGYPVVVTSTPFGAYEPAANPGRSANP